MTGEEREYDYRPGWSLIVFGVVFFGAGAVGAGWQAAVNDRGLIINGLIELGPAGATVFYWGLALAGVVFVGLFLTLAYQRVVYRQRLVFGPESMTVPAGRWSRDEIVIPYQDIRELSEAKVNRQRFLHVTHPGGRFTVMSSMLPSKAAYEEVCGRLFAKVGESSSGE